MTDKQIEQEKHYKEMAEAYIDKCTKARGFVILPMQLRNDFVDLYVAGALEVTKELQEKIEQIHDLEKWNKKLDEAIITSTKNNIERQKIIDNLKEELEKQLHQCEENYARDFRQFEALKQKQLADLERQNKELQEENKQAREIIRELLGGRMSVDTSIEAKKCLEARVKAEAFLKERE